MEIPELPAWVMRVGTGALLGIMTIVLMLAAAYVLAAMIRVFQQWRGRE